MPTSLGRTLRIDVPDLDSVLSADGLAPYPHTGSPLRDGIAEYLEREARLRSREPGLEVEIVVARPLPEPANEDRIRTELARYFREERSMAELDLRLNQREGWGFFRRTAPIAVIVLAVAGVLYAFGPSLHGLDLTSLVAAASYLLAITVVWVLLWDPIEKLLFDAFLLRARVTALEKLAAATIRFQYPSRPTAGR